MHIIILLVIVLIGLLTIPKQTEGFYSPNFFSHGALKHYLFDGELTTVRKQIINEFQKYYKENKGKVSSAKLIKEKLKLTKSEDTADLEKIYWYVKKNDFIKKQRDELHKKLDNVTKSLKEISTTKLESIHKELDNIPSNVTSSKQFSVLDSELKALTKTIDSMKNDSSKFAELDSEVKNLIKTVDSMKNVTTTLNLKLDNPVNNTDTSGDLVISGLKQTNKTEPVDDSDFVVSNVVKPNVSTETSVVEEQEIDQPVEVEEVEIDPPVEAKEPETEILTSIDSSPQTESINTSIINGTTVEGFRGWGR